MKPKRKTAKSTTAVSSRNVPTCVPASRSSKITRKTINEVSKPDYQGPKFSSVHNPLIDDLLGELGTSMASEETPSISLENSDNGNEPGGPSVDYLSITDSPPLSSTYSPSNLSKLAVDTVIKASQCFVHILTKHGLKSYLNSPTDAAKETELRRLLRIKDKNDADNFMLALVEIIEEIFTVGEQLKSLAPSSFNPASQKDNDMSDSLVSVMSTASLMCPPVHETNQLAVAFDQKGHRMINRYVVLANIGEGSYGKVMLAEEMDSGKKVAIKVIDKQFLQKKFGNGNSAAEGDNALMREITIMKKVRHRNCVSLYEVIDDPASQKLYLIMDYVPNGPVVHLRHTKLLPAMLLATEANGKVNGIKYNRYLIRCSIRHRPDGDQPLSDEEIHSEPSVYGCRPLRETICALYLRQLVSGLRYMHDRNVVHHDVKPDNILLGSNGRVYLTDFGVSEILAPHPVPSREFDLARRAGKPAGSTTLGMSGVVEKVAGHSATAARFGGGTLLFTAPELLDPEVDITKVNPYMTDNWALGITLHCMLIGVVPFGGNYYRDVCENIRTRAYPWNGYNLESESVLPEWNTILSGLLEKNPRKRWGLKQLKKFLDSEDFQRKIRQRAEIEATAAPDRRRGSLMNSTSQTRTPIARSVKDPAGAENAPKGSGYCRASGIRQECMRKVARSDGIEVMSRPMRQVSDQTRRIVRHFVETIRSRTTSKSLYFKASDVFPASEGGVTDGILSGKASEDLLKMHNLSITDNRGMMVRSAGSSNGRSSRSGNAAGWEKPTAGRGDHRKKTHSVNAALSLSQPHGFVPITKRNSRAVYSGAFQSIDAILSIVNVQSESFQSNSFSFVSLCEAGSQKSSTYKTAATPSSGLESTQRGLTEPDARAAPPRDLSCSELERQLNATKRGRREGAGETAEFPRGGSVSVSSLLPSRPEEPPGRIPREPPFPAARKAPPGKPLPTAPDGPDKGSGRESKGLVDDGGGEVRQVRISDVGGGGKASRSQKEPRRTEREEKGRGEGKPDAPTQLPSTKEIPNILARRRPSRSRLTSWEVVRNLGGATYETLSLPEESLP